jgi:hypothetical protein
MGLSFKQPESIVAEAVTDRLWHRRLRFPLLSICPYHFEWTDEEWLIAISGRPTLRTPSGV